MADLALFEIDPSRIIDCRSFRKGEPSFVMEGKCHNCHEVVYGRFARGQEVKGGTCNWCGYSFRNISWLRFVGTTDRG